MKELLFESRPSDEDMHSYFFSNYKFISLFYYFGSFSLGHQLDISYKDFFDKTSSCLVGISHQVG